MIHNYLVKISFQWKNTNTLLLKKCFIGHSLLLGYWILFWSLHPWSLSLSLSPYSPLSFPPSFPLVFTFINIVWQVTFHIWHCSNHRKKKQLHLCRKSSVLPKRLLPPKSFIGPQNNKLTHWRWYVPSLCWVLNYPT